jgi:hypothetical protein
MRAEAARQALASGDSREALWVGLKGVASEAAKLRVHRHADGQLTDADLCGLLLALAEGLHEHRPARPSGCARVPRPEDLLAMFGDSFTRHSGGDR